MTDVLPLLLASASLAWVLVLRRERDAYREALATSRAAALRAERLLTLARQEVATQALVLEGLRPPERR